MSVPACPTATMTLDGISWHVVRCGMSAEELAGLGRFAGPATLILSSLAEGSKHGYAITQDVEAFAGVKLQPGTLYGALTRLEHDGLIEALAGVGRSEPPARTP